MEKFKTPLLLNEQIEHLHLKKNVSFDNTNIDFAKNCLLKYNYINVITPFKHYYALKNSNFQLVKGDDQNHIYHNETDFLEYIIRYSKERQSYSTIFQNISIFETNFNSILTHFTITFYNIDSAERFNSFISSLKLNLVFFDKNYKLKEQISRTINSFEIKLNDFNNLYILFDRLSLNDLCNIFRVLDRKLKDKIFKTLLQFNKTLKFKDLNTFELKLYIVVGIRNCICHNNSLEILVRFYDFKRADIRLSSNQKAYRRLIEKLSM